MLRVTTQQQFATSIDNMQKSNVKLDNLQQQISTGKRIMQPSDDPIAAAQVLKLERELAQYDKFDINIKAVDRRLTLQESVMQSFRTSLNRVKELTIQGSTGTLTDSDRASIAVNLKEEADFMAGLMNTKDSQGEYIFSGSKGNTKPYEKQPDGSYDYQGDDGQRKIQVSSELFIPSNDSGQYLFESVATDLQTTIKGAFASQPTTVAPVISNITYKDQAAQDLHTKLTDGLGDITVVVTAGAPPLVTMTDSKGDPVEDKDGNDITARATTAGKLEVLGMEFDVTTAAGFPGNFTGEDTLVLHTQPVQKNILDVVQDYAKALEVPLTNQAKRDDFAVATTKMLDNWDQASERNIESVTQVGSRLSFMEKIKSNNLDFTLFAKTSLSSIQDVDMPEAISKFKLEEVTLQASQQIFGRLSALSLFDHIQS